jgi:hypothetical protein
MRGWLEKYEQGVFEKYCRPIGRSHVDTSIPFFCSLREYGYLFFPSPQGVLKKYRSQIPTNEAGVKSALLTTRPLQFHTALGKNPNGPRCSS